MLLRERGEKPVRALQASYNGGKHKGFDRVKPKIEGAESPTFDRTCAESGAEPELTTAARRLLAPAQALMADLGAPLLSIVTDRRTGAVELLPWDRSFQVGAPIQEQALERPLARAAALELKARAPLVARHLARRWPANAVPPRIGVVTDGTGVAVSPGHPAALTTAWLSDHAARRAPADALLPFHDRGPWALAQPRPDFAAH
jgi:hypothetical protein